MATRNLKPVDLNPHCWLSRGYGYHPFRRCRYCQERFSTCIAQAFVLVMVAVICFGAAAEIGSVPWQRILFALGTAMLVCLVVVVNHQMDDIRGLEHRSEVRAKQLRGIFNAITDVIAVTDTHLVITGVNAAAEKYTGLAKKDLVGRTSSGLLTRNCLSNEDALALDALKSVSMRSFEFQDARTAEEFRLNLIPITDEIGQPAGLIYYVQDLTDERKLQRELRLRDRLVALGRMAASVAHELNNPIASVLGYAEMIERKVDGDEKLSKWVSQIQGAAKQSSEIVSDLLTFARPPQVEREPIDINATIGRVANQFAPRLAETGVALQLELSPFVPEALADERHVTQVLTNLVANAIDALANCPRPTITIRSERSGREVLVSVSDNGPGIPEENQQKIWEPFFTTKKRGKGTGLGLAICKSLVEAQGGHIELSTKPGVGTTFTVALPSRHRLSSTVMDVSPLQRAALRVGGVDRALVVADSDDVCEVAYQVLSRLASRVEMVDDPVMAHHMLEAESFDVIVAELTVKQPGDGLALAENIIRNRPEFVRRILLAVSSAEAGRLETYAGIENFIPVEKPLTPEKLVDSLIQMAERE